MAITWSHLRGDPNGNVLQDPAIVAFIDALFTASPSFATATSFVMQQGTSKIVFEGTFTVTPFFPPSITNGKIAGFSLYVGDVMVIEASGHGLGYQTLMNGVAAAKAGTQSDVDALFGLVFPGPMTVTGSDDADFIIGGEFADLAGGGGSSDLSHGRRRRCRVRRGR